MPYAFARFKNSDGRFAYLIYSAVDADGNIPLPPARPGRLGNRFVDYFGEAEKASNSNVMMMQMFIVADEKLEAERLRDFASDFVQMRSIIQQGVKQRNAAAKGNRTTASAGTISLGREG